MITKSVWTNERTEARTNSMDRQPENIMQSNTVTVHSRVALRHGIAKKAWKTGLTQLLHCRLYVNFYRDFVAIHHSILAKTCYWTVDRHSKIFYTASMHHRLSNCILTLKMPWTARQSRWLSADLYFLHSRQNLAYLTDQSLLRQLRYDQESAENRQCAVLLGQLLSTSGR